MARGWTLMASGADPGSSNVGGLGFENGTIRVLKRAQYNPYFKIELKKV